MYLVLWRFKGFRIRAFRSELGTPTLWLHCYMQMIWPFKRHQWTDCNCFWINVVLNHCESVSIRKNLKSCILDFAAIFSPLNLTVTLWSRSNHGTRLPHGSSLLVSLTSFLPFPNFFYPTFFKIRPYISISLKIWHFVVQKR